VLLQMLTVLEGVDLKALGHNSPAYAHVVTEAMKLAFADRERYSTAIRHGPRADGHAAVAGVQR
jgi:gamma-glutamyltranspeptidase/glutathione hydrolase